MDLYRIFIFEPCFDARVCGKRDGLSDLGCPGRRGCRIRARVGRVCERRKRRREGEKGRGRGGGGEVGGWVKEKEVWVRREEGGEVCCAGSRALRRRARLVGGLISQRLGHHVVMSHLHCGCLSSLLGTLIMGGRDGFSLPFSYVKKFSRLPLKKRQQILLSWSLSWFWLYRMTYTGTKLLIFLSFFTQPKGESDGSFDANDDENS
ncbi:hypothetical protein Droror1_Dr00008385, partial [Drosera rotundifolia]